MRISRSLLLASTILSGVAATMLNPNARAQILHGDALAQAAPANQPQEPKKKPLAKPQPPKPRTPAAAPPPPKTLAPQASHQPARHPHKRVEKPEPKLRPAQVTPPPVPHSLMKMQKPEPKLHPAQVTPRPVLHGPEKMQKPEPKLRPAQVTPPPTTPRLRGKPGPSVTGKRAAPEIAGKPKPGEHPTARGPAFQTAPHAGSPRERAKPAAVTPPTTTRNAGNAPVGKPQLAGKVQPPALAVVRRAPPPPGHPTAVSPPTQVISKGQFLAPKGQPPSAGIKQVRAERHEEHDGDRLIIREPDRTIVQEGKRTFIRHSEVDRFAVGARHVEVERRGNETVTVVMRPDGVQIIDYTDEDGRLLRRVRRDPDGREFVIIDNGFSGAQMGDVFLSLAPPVIRVPRDRYIVDADDADEAAIYGVLVAPPVEHIDRRYTLDQVRYNEPLRAYMPRLDLEVNFDSGSWQLTPDQVDRLSFIAEALNRAIERNPREVFLVEGYTDAVGSDIDNLSLSDRRAESVAVALTEQFHVPAENLATQGYGKQFLKVPTSGPERANRRVAIRRITPLIDPDAVSQR
jgi:outer membrane protein OmpA-like peptidoglycan-associated protein